MAEVLEKWPVDQIGYGLMAGYRYQDRSPRITSKMAGGEDRTRLTSRDVLRDHWFDLRLTPGQLAYFEWWVQAKIDMGESWFEIDLLSGAGMNTSVAKIVKIGPPTRQGMRYRVAVQLLTRARPSVALTEEQALALVDYGTAEVQTGAALLHDTIHTQG